MAKTGHIFIYGEIGTSLFQDGVTADKVRTELDQIKSKNIVLHINSVGGSVFEGQAIYNLLKGSGKDIEVIVEGMCASIATMIALSGDKITMYPMASWLVHNPFANVQGDAEELKKHAATLDEMTNQLVNLYVSKTKREADEIRSLMKEDRPMYAEEALKMGFIDEIVEELKAVARLDMNAEKSIKDIVNNGLSKLETMIAKLIKAKNMNIELDNGSKLWVESEDGDLVEKSVFTTDEEGNSTGEAAPDGDHKLVDGRVITVMDGVITAIMEAPMDEVENLKAQIEALTQELQASKQELEASKESLKEAAEGLIEAKAILKKVGIAKEPETKKKPETVENSNVLVSNFILQSLNKNTHRYGN